MFWTSAVIAPVMMACVYFGSAGVPASPDVGTEAELRRIPVPQRRPRAAVRRTRPGTTARLVAVGRVHRTLRVRSVFCVVCDRPTHARAKPSGRSAIPAQVEHDRSGTWAVFVSFRVAGDGLGHTAVAVVPRSRRRAVRSSRAVDGGAGDVPGRLRRPSAEQGTRFAPVDGPGVRDDWHGVPGERRVHQRMGSRELLQDRAADGRRPVVRVRRARLHAHPAGLLLRRPRFSVPCADVLRVPPRRAHLRRTARDDGDGPLHRGAGESALVSGGASRPAGRLDRGAHGGTPDRRGWRPDRAGSRPPPAARSDSSPAAFACRPTRSPSSTRFTSSPGCRSRR